jgi:hypothetical protein
MNGVQPDWGWSMICFIMGAVVVVDRVVNIFRGSKSQRRVVEMAEEFVTKAELRAVEGDLANLERKIDRGLEKLSDEAKAAEMRISHKGEERAGKLHDRLDMIQEKLGVLRGITSHQEGNQ